MKEQYPNLLNARVECLVFDCDNTEALAHFYAKLLGGTVTSTEYGGCELHTDALPVPILFQEDEDYARPVWPGKAGGQLQMLHIDIRVDDFAKAQEFALSIGAAMPEEQFCQPGWEPFWVTLLDPAGHPSCLEARKERRERDHNNERKK